MQRFIILKGPPAAGRRSTNTGSLAIHPEECSLFAEDMSGSQQAEMLRDPGVLEMVPIMPTALIQPLDASADEADSNWGIQAVGAHTSPFSGLGVTVAILDTGIDASHPAFDNMQLVQRDFSGDGDGDRVGHGSHCAGVIFGRDVSGRVGVARGVGRSLIGKVLRDNGSGTSDMLFSAMLWAMQERADIVSMSLGFDFPGMVEQRIKDGWPQKCAASDALVTYRANLRMLDAIMSVFRAGQPFQNSPLVVAASGNESQRHVNPKFRVAASLPAAADHVISVAAVGCHGNEYEVADFSNTHAMIAGPGVNIVSAWPGGGVRSLSGTSMACPHVAGVAALWWEAIRNSGRMPSAENVKVRLFDTTRLDIFKAGTAEEDVGRGLVTAPQ